MKVHYNQITFTGLEFLNLTQSICFKNFCKHKNCKIPGQIKTHDLVTDS